MTVVMSVLVELHLGSNMELRKKQKQMEKELDQETEVHVLRSICHKYSGFTYHRLGLLSGPFL